MWSCKFGPCFLCSLTSCSNSGGTFQNSPRGTEEILLQIAAPGCTALLPSLESNMRKQCKRGGTLDFSLGCLYGELLDPLSCYGMTDAGRGSVQSHLGWCLSSFIRGWCYSTAATG